MCIMHLRGVVTGVTVSAVFVYGLPSAPPVSCLESGVWREPRAARTPHAAKTFSEEMWRERVLWCGWRPTIIMHS